MPALDTVNASGDVGGDGCFGFQFANPAGLERGGPLSGDKFTAFVSKAAILSRREPDLGLGGVLGESDMIKVALKKAGFSYIDISSIYICLLYVARNSLFGKLNHEGEIISLGSVALNFS